MNVQENKKKESNFKVKNYKWITYLIFIVIIIGSLIPMGILFWCLYCSKESEFSTIYSTWISVLASISFGALVSIVVQIINDLRERRTRIFLINTNRARLIEKINNIINNFISSYHDCEVILLNNFEFMKDSYSGNKLDFSTIIQNLCFAEKLKIMFERDAISKELNAYLLNEKSMRNQYNDMVRNLKEIAIEMQNMNLLSALNIFIDDEINDFLLLTEIVNNSILDAQQAQAYLKIIFKIVDKYKFKLNVYINDQWLLVLLAMVIVYEEDSIDEKRKIADSIMTNYFNNSK